MEKREGGSAGEWDKLEKREVENEEKWGELEKRKVKMGRSGMGWNIGEGKWGGMGRVGIERRRRCRKMG